MTNTEELKDIPYSIRSGLMPKSVVTFEGLSTKLDVSRRKNSNLSDGLLIYNPVAEDNGLNFGVMLYKHDNFKDTYQVNPHKLNFDKDRETLIVGSTHYPADIGRYKKGTEEKNYTLKLNKKVRSPLFVPTSYKETELFLVLFPLDDLNDDPPLIVDEDDVDNNAKAEELIAELDQLENEIDLLDQENVVIEKPQLEKPLTVEVHTAQTKEEYMDDIDFDNKEKLAEFKTAEFMKHRSWHKKKHRQQKSKPYNNNDDDKPYEYNIVYEDEGLKMLFEPTVKVEKEVEIPVQSIDFS